MGERTPHLDPNARAALIGLTASPTPAGMWSARILEGVAFSLRDSFTLFAEMGVSRPEHSSGRRWERDLRCGGQIQADVYGREVEVLEAEEGRGPMERPILAGVGAGVWSSVRHRLQ